MARLLVNGEWFEQIASTSLYEADFEAIVLEHSPFLYPSHFVVQFKRSVYSEDGVAKPDLALIDRKFRGWWVVEIEMAHHSFTNHILPQVQTLSKAVFGEEEADYISNASHDLDSSRLRDMMKGKQPRVIVLLNAARPEWVPALARYDAILTVVEVFRSRLNKQVFLLSGDSPTEFADNISRCYFDPLIPRFLIIESPASLGIQHGQRVRIRYENAITEWERIDVQDKVWLRPIEFGPLPPGQKYDLLKEEDGDLFFRPAPKS